MSMMKEKNKIFAFIGSFILMIGCSVNKSIVETSSGKYQLVIKGSAKQADPVIYGLIFDYGAKEVVHIAAIKVDDKAIHKAGIDGKFAFGVKPGKYRFTGVGLSYETCKTKYIIVSAGDSVNLNIYLKPDLKPLY